MSINLSVSLSHPSAIATQVRYARIDNLAPGQQPVFTTIPNLVGGEGVFDIASNLPNGQYQINYAPIYADGRQCTTYTTVTPGCPGLTSISAVIQGNVIIINYLAPAGVPNVFITVGFPNGGNFQQMYVNDGNPISIGIPAGVYGNYTVNGQSVCDASSGFYSPASSTVTVPFNQPISGTYYLGNSQSAVCAASPTTLYSSGAPIPGSILYLDSALTTRITGYSLVMYQNVIYNLDPTEGILGTNSGLSCSPTVVARSSLSFMNVNAITGIPGFTYSPVSGAFNQTGSHSAFTGPISTTISGTIPASPSFSIQLFQNGNLIACIPLTNGNTYTSTVLNFGTFSFAANDIISIDFGTGGCS